MIVILTRGNDLGADLVIRHLARWNLEYRRVNTEAIGTPALRLGVRGGYPTLGSIDATTVSAVWARRFAHPSIVQILDPAWRQFATREFGFTLDAFLAATPGLQVNRHDVDRMAGNRLIQAARAVKAGFRVPATLVTQDPAEAQDFIAAQEVAVTKAVSFGILDDDGKTQAYTALVGADFDLSGLQGCPALFQAFIPKQREWRVTTVGTRVFAACTRAASAVDGVDWRRSPDTAAIFEPGVLPADVETRLLTLCETSGLVFGTHDLIESTNGEFVFLETNPAGQWGWLELHLGLPIGETLASVLAEGRPP